MNENEELLLLARALEDGRVALCAPMVGLWSGAPVRGARLEAGQGVGSLQVLSRAHALRAPAGISGVVDSAPPTLRHAPVGYGDRLVVLAPAPTAHAESERATAASPSTTAHLLHATQSGRFWRRPEASAPPFVEVGGDLEEGRSYGLLEVMKTFQPLKYRAGADLPARARLLRWLVEDGAEVAEGEALAEVGD